MQLNLAWPWVSGWWNLILSRHLAKFGHVTLWLVTAYYNSPPCHVHLPLASWERRYNLFCSSRNLTWAHDQSATWVCRWWCLMLSYHHVRFGGYERRRYGDILIFICHMISRDVGRTFCVVALYFESQRHRIWWL